MTDSLENRIEEAIRNPRNMGEMEAADSVGTAGSPGCGDMMRMWLKFKEGGNGEKVIEKASFQAFGCETAIAVASVATDLLAGKTVDQALSMKGEDLAAPLGALPPMKIHCATLVEEALRYALEGTEAPAKAEGPTISGLVESLSDEKRQPGKAKIVLLPKNT